MTEIQTTLPFREWRISPRWGALLAIINTWAGRLNSYDEPRWHVYRLKDRILSRHAIPDGTDLQVIKLHCRACDGRGYFGWSYHSTCDRCFGSGVYARDYITLARFRIGERVFHVPGNSSRILDSERRTTPVPSTEGHRNVIDGRIEHPHAPVLRFRWLAFLVLTLRFDPRATGTVLALYRNHKRRALRAWWVMGGGARVRWALADLRALLTRKPNADLYDTQVPF